MKIMATTLINCNQKTNNNLTNNISKGGISFGTNLVLPGYPISQGAYYALLIARENVRYVRPLTHDVIVDVRGLWANVEGKDCVIAKDPTRLVIPYSCENVLQSEDTKKVLQTVMAAAHALEREVQAIIRGIASSRTYLHRT